MSYNITPRQCDVLTEIKSASIKLTNEGKMTDERSKLLEQLVLHLSDPRNEWGKNNLRDLIVLFHDSGRSPEQIYNILYTMGVEKETAWDGIMQYLPRTQPQNNQYTMKVKEQLNISGKVQSLIESMNSLNTGDSLNYTVKTIVSICESFLKNDLSGLSAYDHSSYAKSLISQLNQYSHIKQVSEAIKSIEDVLAENAMSLELDNLYSKLSSKNSNNTYTTVIGKLDTFKTMNESEIREKSKSELVSFNYIPEVRLFLENVDLTNGVVAEDTNKSAVSKYDLKGRLRTLHENINKYEAPNSHFTVNTIKTICEKYINQLYKGNISVSESYVTALVIKELESFMWLDSVKESVTDAVKYINENMMSFEVNETLRRLRNMNGNNFYATAVTKLEEFSNLSESEIRERIKYDMNAFTWIPEAKRLVETVNHLEHSLSSNTEAVVENVYSQIMQIDGKNAFYLNKKVYSIDENNQITPVDYNKLTALYLTLIAVTENFKFNGDVATYFKGNNSIKFQLTENGTSVKFNDTEVEIKESADLRNFLLSNGSFGVNDMAELDMVAKAFENLSSFTQLDFVQSIHSRMHKGVIVNVIKLDENVYINRVNPYMNTNEFIKASTAADAIGLVKEYVNYDIKTSLVDLLEGEAKQAAIIEAKKEDLFDKITFLKEQRSILAKQPKNNLIQEADNLLASEIEKFEKELNELTK